MIRLICAICALASLVACSGGTTYSSHRAATVTPAYIPVTPGARPVTPVPASVSVPAQPSVLFATGPIYSACRSAQRKAASRQRCGCIQWVADQELSDAQQKRGAHYFSNQGALQKVRQSDASSNERFWTAWKAYGQTAAQMCKGS